MSNKYDFLTLEFLEQEHLVKNKPLKVIARENKIPEGSIFYLAKRLGLKNRSSKETNRLLFTRNIPVEKVIDSYTKENKTMEQIAKDMNCCRTTVFKLLKLYNISTRPYGSWKVWNKGLKGRYSLRHQGQFKKGHKPWNCGLGTNQEYPLEFNSILREEIRQRDNYKCTLCKKSQIDNGKKLAIHHIDYNKTNSNKDNLISLCDSCHNKTHCNREYWENKFSKFVRA